MTDRLASLLRSAGPSTSRSRSPNASSYRLASLDILRASAPSVPAPPSVAAPSMHVSVSAGMAGDEDGFGPVADGEDEQGLLVGGASGYTPYLVMLTAIACLGGLQFGWDTGMASGMLVAIHEDLGHALSAGEQELVVSATTVGALVGALIAGRLSDWMGRKKVMVGSGIMFFLGSLEQAASQVVTELVIGRFIVGVGVGSASTITPMFLAEVAPASVRGPVIAANSLLITGGQVVAYLIDAALYPVPHGWRLMVLAGAVPALIQLIGLLLLLDESPRWLVQQRRFAEARDVLRRIYPGASVQQLDRQVDRLERSVKHHQPGPGGVSSAGPSSANGSRVPTATSSNRLGLRQQLDLLFSKRSHRRAVTLACVLQAAQQGCGSNSLIYFSSRLLKMAGFTTNPNTAATGVAVANFVGTIVGLRLIDGWGRRKLLLWTTAAAAVSLAFLAGSFAFIKVGDVVDGVKDGDEGKGSAAAWICVLAMWSFLFTYAPGLGLVPWVVGSEVLVGPARGLGSGLAVATNWSVNLLLASTFLHFVKLVTPSGAFWTFCAITTLSWLFIYRNLPETAGVPMSEMEALLDPGSTYEPVAAEDIDEGSEEGQERTRGRDVETPFAIGEDDGADDARTGSAGRA